ncbi:uncharacterized protein [Palaemon carinicauda]|uniref:uncharacterized protein n=1 Tax=Palaemon carinicauda TaxID=392227 RepID=UPI0035B68BC6
MDGVMQELEEQERVIVGADLDGHVGSENEAIGRVHGGHGIGERNPEGESVVDFAVSFDRAIVNIFFKKKREHLITYRSGGRCSQIDYFLYKRIKLVEVKNCKAIPGDHLAPQHRLLYPFSENKRLVLEFIDRDLAGVIRFNTTQYSRSEMNNRPELVVASVAL